MNLADCVIVLENILRSAIDITLCKKVRPPQEAEDGLNCIFLPPEVWGNGRQRSHSNLLKYPAKGMIAERKTATPQTLLLRPGVGAPGWICVHYNTAGCIAQVQNGTFIFEGNCWLEYPLYHPIVG